ncbi:MAG TPA: ATP-binding protein [Chloroflexota bacterium]
MLVELQVALFVALAALAAAFAAGRSVARRGRSADPAWRDAPLGVLTLRGDRYGGANAEARRLLALPGEEGELPEAAWRAALVEDARPPGASRILALARPSPDPPQPVRWRAVPLDDGGALVFVSDLADQRRAELAAQRFLGALSHELRTPLTAILAHVELLRGAASLDVAQRSSVAFIHRETERIARLVADLLELGRLNSAGELPLRPIDPLLVAEEAVAAVILVAEERRVDLELQAASPQPRVLADPDRIKQVFLNLLDNAVKYARAGDRVVVRLEPEGGRVVCTVRDSGPGIPPEHLAHVRERLYRGRRDVEGSGLGLALVEEILRLHHTELRLESRTDGPERGTVARFELKVEG